MRRWGGTVGEWGSPTVSLSYRPTVPPPYCPTAPSPYCPTVSLSHLPTVPPSHCPTALLSHRPLSHCPTVPRPTVPPSHCPTISLSYCPLSKQYYMTPLSMTSFHGTLHRSATSLHLSGLRTLPQGLSRTSGQATPPPSRLALAGRPLQSGGFFRRSASAGEFFLIHPWCPRPFSIAIQDQGLITRTRWHSSVPTSGPLIIETFLPSTWSTSGTGSLRRLPQLCPL